eukprot:scaffold1146_cov399-Prasinococcus_capsulatus_cf.AAC.59
MQDCDPGAQLWSPRVACRQSEDGPQVTASACRRPSPWHWAALLRRQPAVRSTVQASDQGVGVRSFGECPRGPRAGLLRGGP